MPAAANKWGFLAAPVVAVTTALLAVAVLPYGPPFSLPRLDWLPGWLAWLWPAGLQGRSFQIQIADDRRRACCSSSRSRPSACTAIVLAGWAANSKYSLLGGLRSSAQMFSYELALGLSWVGIIMLAGSFQIGDIVNAQAGGFWRWNVFWQFPAFLVYFIARDRGGRAHPVRPAGGRDRARRRLPHRVLLDALRAPADGRVHQHDHGLGAVHEPVPRRLAVGDPRRAVRRACSASSGGGSRSPALLFVFIWLRGTLPRFRYDQLMHFGWKVLIPVAAVWILVTATAHDALPGLLPGREPLMDAILFYVFAGTRRGLRRRGDRPEEPDLPRPSR